MLAGTPRVHDWGESPAAARRRRLPQGNAIVLAVLRSRAHRLLSGAAIELHYVGRRSGRHMRKTPLGFFLVTL
jgi:hypothetical protein